MSRLSYGRKKDFGFHKGGAVFRVQDTGVEPPPASNYRSTMPAYNAYDRRGQHGKLDISRPRSSSTSPNAGAVSTAASNVEASSTEKKAKRSWFGGRKKSKKRSLESEIISEEKVVRSSPILHVRPWGTADVDQFGRPQTEPSGEREEEERMQSYDEPKKNASSELLRLTLRSKKSQDTLQITLRKKGQGFGIHLSGGLPPITVTYVEPGGEAEMAGVMVGDVVVEVNGENCESGLTSTKVMELKMMIQQTRITEQDTTGYGREEDSGLNDTAWKKIQAKQLQDEIESRSSTSAPVQMKVTEIDDVSDNESTVTNKSKEKTVQHSQQEIQREISQKEWERVREQRELVFNHNTPSGIIREKGKERELSSKQPESAVSSASKMTQKSQSSSKAASSQSSTTATKGKSKAFWSKKKDKDAAGPGIGGVEAAAVKKGKKISKEGAGKKNKKEGKSATAVKELSQSRVNGGGSRMESEVNQITSIDEDDSDIEVTPTEDVGLPRTKQTPQTAPASLEQPNISHRRSRSYEGEDEAGEKAGGESNLSKSQSNLNHLHPASKVEIASNLKVKKSGVVKEVPSQGSGRRTSLEVFREQEEGKVGGIQLSKSQSNISSSSTSANVIENLKVKKSGVVKGVASHGSGRRVSLEMFGVLKSTREVEVETEEEATDGPLPDDTIFAPANRNSVMGIDLAAIPYMTPTLGADHGHIRRDLVTRSSRRRRAPSSKVPLLLSIDDSQKMGTKRVEVPEISSKTRPKPTTPEKINDSQKVGKKTRSGRNVSSQNKI